MGFLVPCSHHCYVLWLLSCIPSYFCTSEMTVPSVVPVTPFQHCLSHGCNKKYSDKKQFMGRRFGFRIFFFLVVCFGSQLQVQTIMVRRPGSISWKVTHLASNVRNQCSKCMLCSVSSPFTQSRTSGKWHHPHCTGSSYFSFHDQDNPACLGAHLPSYFRFLSADSE